MPVFKVGDSFLMPGALAQVSECDPDGFPRAIVVTHRTDFTGFYYPEWRRTMLRVDKRAVYMFRAGLN